MSEAGAYWGEQTALSLVYAGARAAASAYAYELVHLHHDWPEAHRAIMRCELPVYGDPTDAAAEGRPDAVAPGTAVRYADVATGAERWVIIEDARRPVAERSEVSPQHPLARRLMGKRAGETFLIEDDEIERREGRVMAVGTKAAGRAYLSADAYRDHFPDEPFFVRQFELPKTGDDGLDPSALYRIARAREEAVREVERDYKQHHLPVACFAGMLGVPVAEAVGYLASRAGVGIAFCHGSVEEAERAMATLREARELVVDPTAVAVLLFSEADRHLCPRPPRPLVVSTGTLAELERMQRDAAESAERVAGYLTAEGGRERVVPAEPQVRRRWAERVAEFLNRTAE